MFNRKKTPVTEVPRVTVQDGVIAGAWGLSLMEWAALTNEQRRDLRNRVAYAPAAS
jgi:hypothetical protein